MAVYTNGSPSQVRRFTEIPDDLRRTSGYLLDHVIPSPWLLKRCILTDFFLLSSLINLAFRFLEALLLSGGFRAPFEITVFSHTSMKRSLLLITP